MSNASPKCHHPICILAHDLVNDLSVIVGHCDLMLDVGQSDEQRAKHLSRIRQAAKSMADKLKHHQCQLASLARTLPRHQEEKVIT